MRVAREHANERRLRITQTNGELAASADPLSLAGIASAILHSLAMRSRAGDSRAVLRALAEAGTALICGSSGMAEKQTKRRTRRARS